MDLVKNLGRGRCALDTETTGIDVRAGERIVSIGAARGTLDGGIGDTRCWIVDTDGRPSGPDAYRIHRIAQDDPRRVPESVAIPAMREFVGDRIAVFQNGAFDMGFLDAACERLHLQPFRFEVEDTILLGRKRFPGKAMNLDSLCRLTGIEGTMADRRKLRHDVVDDCMLTFEVWRRLVAPTDLELAGDTGAGKVVSVVETVAETAEMEW